MRICACSAVTGHRNAYERLNSPQFVLKHLSQKVLPDHSGGSRSTTQTSARGGSADLVDAPETASSRPVAMDEEKDAVTENAGHQDRKAPVSVPHPALASLPSNAAARSGERAVHTELPLSLNAMEKTPRPREDAAFRASVIAEGTSTSPISRRMNSEDSVQSGRAKQSPMLVPCASQQEGVCGVPQQQLQIKERIQQQQSPNQHSCGEPASGHLPRMHLEPDDSKRVKHLAQRLSEKLDTRSPQVPRTVAHTHAHTHVHMHASTEIACTIMSPAYW